jgi:hypothetical protein
MGCEKPTTNLSSIADSFTVYFLGPFRGAASCPAEGTTRVKIQDSLASRREDWSKKTPTQNLPPSPTASQPASM